MIKYDFIWSPDASKSLETIDVNTTYIIGGLVDETVSKKVTIDKCANLKLNSYSLPIEKYMSRQKAADGVNHFKVFNYSKILAINQVFDIMANFFMSNDWPKALACGVPKRKGFCIKNASETEESSDTKEKPVVLDWSQVVIATILWFCWKSVFNKFFVKREFKPFKPVKFHKISFFTSS